MKKQLNVVPQFELFPLYFLPKHSSLSFCSVNSKSVKKDKENVLPDLLDRTLLEEEGSLLKVCFFTLAEFHHSGIEIRKETKEKKSTI